MKHQDPGVRRVELITLLLAFVWLGATPARGQVPRRTAVRSAPATPATPAGEHAAFDRAVDRLPAEPWRSVPAARSAPIWDLLDALVIRRLNAGVGLDSLNAELATLHRYEPATAGVGERIGGGIYWRELPRELPSWFVGALSGDDRLLGLYNLGLSTGGRATLFSRSAGGWRVAGRIAATLPLSLTVVPGADASPGLVAVERFTGADRSQCTVSLWRVVGGRLLRDRLLPGTYWDCETAAAGSSVLFTYAQMPGSLSGGVLGPRLLSEMSLALKDDRWSIATRPLNPWLHEYDRFYRLGGKGAARAIAARASLLRGMSPHVLDDGGDAAGGSGWVLVEDARGQRRVEMEAAEKGTWQVVRVVEVTESTVEPGPPRDRE